MAELASEEKSLEGSEQDPTVEKRSTRFFRLKLVFFLIVVVLVECVFAYLYLPSVQSEASPSSQVVDAESLLELEAAEQQPPANQVEFDLGVYSEATYKPTSGTTLRIDFHLYGMVEESDLEELTLLYTNRQQRIKEQVGIIVRSSEINDLADAGLGLIHRRILEKINRTLGKPILTDVMITEFSFIEQ